MVLITGSAGFIGHHVSRALLEAGHDVVGIDAMTDYYDVELKRRRNDILLSNPGYEFHELALENADGIDALVARHKPQVVIHLAAQAGVRYSLEAPQTYISANIVGTSHLLEACRRNQPAHFLFASSSSVYGGSGQGTSEETDPANSPLSLYAATKKAGEALTHAFAHLHEVPVTCMRFFTVYGPWGRPDMAIFKFTDAIARGKPIDVYGNGKMRRDFTYIDDLVAIISRLIDRPPETGKPVSADDTLSAVAPWRVVNIGGGNPVELGGFIAAIEQAIGRQATKRLLPMQPGDVTQTFASTALLEALTGKRPSTDVVTGVRNFVRWYLETHSPALAAAQSSQF